jgi:hypothetical protein
MINGPKEEKFGVEVVITQRPEKGDPKGRPPIKREVVEEQMREIGDKREPTH